MAEPTHLNSGSGLGRGGRSVRTDGTTAIPEEKSATRRGSFVSGIFNIGERAFLGIAIGLVNTFERLDQMGRAQLCSTGSAT